MFNMPEKHVNISYLHHKIDFEPFCKDSSLLKLKEADKIDYGQMYVGDTEREELAWVAIPKDKVSMFEDTSCRDMIPCMLIDDAKCGLKAGTYLIGCHGNDGVREFLLNCLDYEDSTCVIHRDKFC